ncbi:MAG: hypothetical protein A3J79_03085 [Elusimicrobia bacterium RIFOXYB2_FULL_62_6]|nr:MAG: hypothetical protein A3J79_03085 [Elusimicrobia bacterium RIFOXYB2_FULL_62_6]
MNQPTGLLRALTGLCLCVPLLCLPAAAAPGAPIVVGDQENEIKRGDLDVFVKVTGLSTVQDTYDIYAPFDGRIEDVLTELFSLVSPDTILSHMVSTEMAALLDASTEESKKQTEKRWQDVYDYYTIKPEFEGILTNIYVKPKDRVYKGSRLFTVARKVVIIGKNLDPLYAKLAGGMTAELVYTKDPDVKLKGLLTNFIRIKDSPFYNRLWLEVTDLRSGLRIGEQFNGFLSIGRSEDTLIVPRSALFEKFGRKYLIMEVETGLSTDDEIEVLKPGLHYIKPAPPKAQPATPKAQPAAPKTEKPDGKAKKTD